ADFQAATNISTFLEAKIVLISTNFDHLQTFDSPGTLRSTIIWMTSLDSAHRTLSYEASQIAEQFWGPFPDTYNLSSPPSSVFGARVPSSVGRRYLTGPVAHSSQR